MWRMYIRSHVRAHASTYACIIYICIHIRVVYIYILGDVLGALGTYVGTCVHIYRIRLIRISNQQIGAHSLPCSLRTIILDITARITSATQLPFCLFALIKLARNLSRLIHMASVSFRPFAFAMYTHHSRTRKCIRTHLRQTCVLYAWSCFDYYAPLRAAH